MNMYLAKLAYPVLGGAFGFFYYKFVGCSTGTCPIMANPVSSTLYGLILGLALSFGR